MLSSRSREEVATGYSTDLFLDKLKSEFSRFKTLVTSQKMFCCGCEESYSLWVGQLGFGCRSYCGLGYRRQYDGPLTFLKIKKYRMMAAVQRRRLFQKHGLINSDLASSCNGTYHKRHIFRSLHNLFVSLSLRTHS